MMGREERRREYEDEGREYRDGKGKEKGKEGGERRGGSREEN